MLDGPTTCIASDVTMSRGWDGVKAFWGAEMTDSDGPTRPLVESRTRYRAEVMGFRE